MAHRLLRDHHVWPDGAGGFWFSRKPRLAWHYTPPALKLPDPPALPPRPQSLGAIVFTALSGTLVTLVTAVAFGGNPVMLWVSGASLLTTAAAVVHQIVARSGTNRARAELAAGYRERLGAFEHELATRNQQELSARRDGHPPAEEHLGRCQRRDDRLWERRPQHSDFLSVRLGTADIPSAIVIHAPGSGSDGSLAGEGAEIARKYRLLSAAPFTIRFGEGLQVLGLAGDEQAVTGVARAVLVSLAALHGPDDLRLAVLAGSADADGERPAASDWNWLKWLPHSAPLPAMDSADPLIAGHDMGRTKLIWQLARELASRQGGNPAGPEPPADQPAIVVLCTDKRPLMESPLGQELLARGPASGFCFIILGTSEGALPSSCQGTLVLEAGADAQALRGRFTLGDAAGPPVVVSVESLSHEAVQRAARSLAPLRPHEATAAGQLPSDVQLVETLRLSPLHPGDAAKWWLAGARDPTIRATLGLGTGPDGGAALFELDLERQGPHGLIAGTTGSGKSELLLSIVLSLAWKYHPHRAAFILIDYKGGAAFGPAIHLPHTLGLVTDLDEQLAHRALVALKAELKRRERLFAEHGAASISAYQKVPGAPPLPHLFVIVDELAQLLKEVPTFVDGLVSVAQTGRALGVHLILATQRPEGVVAGPVQANANFRICLRVVDAGESMSVLGSPAAATIPGSLPGRAYIRIAQEPLRLFQAARVSGRALAGYQRLRATLFAPEGPPSALPEHLLAIPDQVTAETATDLPLLVEHIREAARSEGVQRLPSPWPDPLPSAITLCHLDDGHATETRSLAIGRPPDSASPATSLWPALPGWSRPPAGGWLSAPLGLLDRPSEQSQGPWTVDLRASGHLLVLGTFGSGADWALATLATSLALTHSPDDLRIYALDFGVHALRPLEDFPHCADVVGPADPAKCRRLFRLLEGIVAERKRLLGEAGAGDWTTYRAATAGDAHPYVLLLIDSFAAFAEGHESLVDLLPALLREGRAVGVHVAIAGDQAGAVPMRVGGLIEGGLMLRQADAAELRALAGLRGDEVPKAMPPGRGFWRGAQALEVQVAYPVGGRDGEAWQDALRRLGAVLKERWNGEQAPPIPVLPPVVPLQELLAWGGVAGEPARAQDPKPETRNAKRETRNEDSLSAPFALDDETLSPVSIDLRANPTLLVAGPRGSGRTSSLVTLVRSLAQRYSPEEVRFYLAAAGDGPLAALGDLPHVARLDGQEACVARPSGLPRLLDQLQDALNAGARPGGPSTTHVLVLDDYDLLAARAGEELERGMAALLGRAQGGRFALVASGKLADLEARFDEAIRRARAAGHALLLCPRDRAQVEPFGALVPRDLVVDWVPGRAIYTVEGEWKVVQVGLT